MDKSSAGVAQELAMSLLGVPDFKTTTLRKWLVESEFRTSNEQDQAIRLLSGRPIDQARFIGSQEKLVAVEIEAFSEKCRQLDSAERGAKSTELLAELDSAFRHTQYFPRLASRRDLFERVLSVEPPDESSSSITPTANDLAERLLRMSLLHPRQRSIARRTLLYEAQAEPVRWSKDAALLKEQYQHIAAIDAPLVEELLVLRTLKKRLRAASEATAGVSPNSFGLALLLVAGILILVIVLAREGAQPRQKRRASFKAKPSPKFPEQDLLTKMMLRTQQLEKTVEEDGTIADRVELAHSYLTMGTSPGLTTMMILQGKKPPDLKPYLKRARAVLPSEYRPRENALTVDGFLVACQRIAVDHDEHAVEVLQRAVSFADSVDAKSLTDTQRSSRARTIAEIFAALAGQSDESISAYDRRGFLEEAVDFATTSIVADARTGSVINLCEYLDRLTLVDLQADSGARIPSYLIRVRTESANVPLGKPFRRKLMITLATQFARLHGHQDEQSLNAEPKAKQSLVNEVITTLKLAVVPGDDLRELSNNEAFRSLRSSVEYRRFLMQVRSKPGRSSSSGQSVNVP